MLEDSGSEVTHAVFTFPDGATVAAGCTFDVPDKGSLFDASAGGVGDLYMVFVAGGAATGEVVVMSGKGSDEFAPACGLVSGCQFGVGALFFACFCPSCELLFRLSVGP